MTDTPGWIRWIFQRYSAGHALHSEFLLDQDRENIASLADGQPDGRASLRRESLALLDSSDPNAVAMALVCLGVVGESEDLPLVDGFVHHSEDLIRCAAKSCRFEIVHRGRG
jgi:hypothetical protein